MMDYALKRFECDTWEVSSHETDSGSYVGGQVVLKDDIEQPLETVIENLCKKYRLDSVKVYKKFESSEVTGKRDYQLLKDDKKGYFCLSNGKLSEVSYENNKRMIVYKE